MLKFDTMHAHTRHYFTMLQWMLSYQLVKHSSHLNWAAI